MLVFALAGSAAACGGEPRDLEAPVIPESGEVIDCKGGAIPPGEPWEPDGDDDFAVVATPAVFLHDVQNVTVRNCTIEGFEVGVLVVGGGNHQIINNVIDSPAHGVWVTDAADVEIADNEIRAGEHGVFVTRRALRTHIARNAISSDQPGARAVLNGDAPDAVVNYLVDGVLVQVPDAVGGVEGTVIEDNDIVGAVVYLAVRSKDPVARNNRITATQEAVRLPGFPEGGRIRLPGTCSGAASRLCGSDRDCALDGLDPVPLGSCVFSGPAECSISGEPCATAADCSDGEACGQHIEDELRVQSARVVANEIADVCVGINLAFTPDAVVEGNALTGRGTPGVCAVGQGIRISNARLFEMTIRDNSIRDFEVGLVIEASGPTEVSARVYRNDIAGNTLDYGTGGWFPSVQAESFELSYEGEGNFWGYGCDAPTGAFPSRSVCRGGESFWDTCTDDVDCPGSYCAALPLIDSHPFGAPIAESTAPCGP